MRKSRLDIDANPSTRHRWVQAAHSDFLELGRSETGHLESGDVWSLESAKTGFD